MKKKLISLLLCIAMLMTFMLASCTTATVEEEEDEELGEGPRRAMTLVWALVCDEVPSETTQQSIEDAINKITESRYTTHIALEFYTDDEYAEAVEVRLEANLAEAEKRNEASKIWKRFVKANRVIKNEDGSTIKVETERLFEMFWESFPEYEKYIQPEETTVEGQTETEAETVLNEWNIGVLAYPEPEEFQIDILYVSGYDNYVRYVNNEWLAPLDESLTEDARILTDYVFPAFMSAVDSTFGTYAIPNNNTIGDYTYLLLHKQLIEKYYYVPENITGLTTELCQNFLYDVITSEAEGFVPLLNNAETKTPQNVKFWGLGYTTDEDGAIISQTLANRYSVLGSTYSKTATQAKDGNSVYQCMVLLNDSNYTNQLKVLKQYECDGYYGAGDAETRPFAAGIVTGDMVDLVPKYEDDYHMIVIDYPRGEEKDLFQHMWGVSAYCKDVDRAMEIITYLNTNVDFRNLIQYGIKDVHYSLDPVTGLATRLTNDYKMDINKTGNVFLAYPEVGMNPDAWTYGKLQNQNAKVDLWIGFSVSNFEEVTINIQGMDRMAYWTQILQDDLAACNNAEDIDDYISGFNYTPGMDLTKIQEILIMRNEYDADKAGTVKGILSLLNGDEVLKMMYNANYDPSDDYAVIKEGDKEVTISNKEHFGYGDSIYAYYMEWAKDNKFFVPAGE